MGRYKIVVMADQLAAVQRYLDGSSIREVAEWAGVGGSRVRKWVHAHAPGMMRSPSASTLNRREQNRGSEVSPRIQRQDEIALAMREALARLVPRGTSGVRGFYSRAWR